MTARGTTSVSPHVRRGSLSEPRRRGAMGWHAPPQTLKAQTARHKYVLANVHALPTPTAHPSADAYPAETSTAQGATHISTKPARGEAAAPIESEASIQAADALFLSDGRRLTLRQLGAADRDGLATLFARLSPESRRRRYLGTKTELTTVELARLTDIDHVHHEAIAAIDQCDGSIVGIARYVRDAGGADVAEVAIEVADAFQRIGHRHRTRQPHDPARARQRPDVPHRHDTVGEPRRARC